MDIKSLEREFAYTRWEHCCKDPTIIAGRFVDPQLRECRRPRGHDGKHASGFGPALALWGDAKPNTPA